MRIFILFIYAVLLLDCSHKKETSIREQLEGRWVHEPLVFSGDTLFWTIEDDFEGPSTFSFVLKLDSGLFRYTTIDSIEYAIEPYLELSIMEMAFLNDSTGGIFYYTLDTSSYTLATSRVLSDDPKVYTSPTFFLIEKNIDGAIELSVLDSDSLIYVGNVRIEADSLLINSKTEMYFHGKRLSGSKAHKTKAGTP